MKDYNHRQEVLDHYGSEIIEGDGVSIGDYYTEEQTTADGYDLWLIVENNESRVNDISEEAYHYQDGAVEKLTELIKEGNVIVDWSDVCEEVDWEDMFEEMDNTEECIECSAYVLIEDLQGEDEDLCEQCSQDVDTTITEWFPE